MSLIIKPGDVEFKNMFGFITSYSAEMGMEDYGFIEFEGEASGSEYLDDMISMMLQGNKFPYYKSEFLCLHCGSPQPVTRTHCKQCGAPRSFILG